MRIVLWCVSLVMAFVAAAVSDARAAESDLPTVEALRAKIAAAAGTRPASSYERVLITRPDGGGTRTIVRAGDDYRETDGFGPLATAHGEYQKQAWHQNPNGQTVLEQPDPGAAAQDVYMTTVSRVSAPVDAYVIARLNPAGGGTKDYVDPITSRIVRHEFITPALTVVTSYDDFRTVAGYTRAWHWTARDGRSEDDADYRIDTFVARPVDASELAIPPPRRALVEFPAGKTSVDLPVTLVDDLFIVRITIGGRGLDFVLDSGAAGISLDESVARQLGLHELDRYSNAANAGIVRESTAIVPEMDAGELRMRDVVIQTLPEFRDNLPNIKIVGLLGFDFIAELLLRLDYEHGRVSAMQMSDLQVDAKQRGTVVLDVRLGSQVPLTTVTINGARGERFLVDTGNAGGLVIDDYFVRRYPHALVNRGGTAAYGSLLGVGGRVDVRPYRLAQVTLGNVTFADFVAARVLTRGAYAGNQDGAIGVDELRLFTVWLDYGDSQIVLIPNADGRRAMK